MLVSFPSLILLLWLMILSFMHLRVRELIFFVLLVQLGARG